ncbi:MAG TPA: transferrin-binding protein-like solute binding protein, partial [Campylobacterales bacterium]|nr:transferrin-binding protein-like solute binding protein [Campylobacterales bacterium]
SKAVDNLVNDKVAQNSVNPWASAYGSDYVPGEKYLVSGQRMAFYVPKANFGDPSNDSTNVYLLDGDALNFELSLKNKIVAGNAIYSNIVPSVNTLTVSGEDSFSFNFNGDVSGSAINPSNSKLYTIADSGGVDYVSWGYWQAEYGSAGSEIIKFGTWIGGVPTAVADMPQNVVAQYSGKIIGGVLDASQGYTAISMNANNAVNLTVNFGAAYPISGTINFDVGTSQWRTTINSANTSVTDNTFSAAVVASVDGGNAGSMGSINGNFYGPNAKTMAGAFAVDYGSNQARGVFKATKQ